MRVQHNIPAMNAYRNFNSNTKAIAKNLEKLSSGYRINRAGDDAAGLAISEKMRAQITGLNVAQKNAKDGISLVQTAEGALTEVHSMLNRMFSLSEQSANGTYDNEVDRANLQKEFSALRTEIDRIADASNFNGQALLNGDLKTTSTTTSTSVITVGSATTTDGVTPTAASKASVTIELGAGATGGLVITPGTTTGTALATLTVDGKDLGDLFEIKVNGSAATGTPLAAGDKIELVAKTAGALSSTAMSDLNSITGAASLSVVDGVNEGGAPAATKAEYTLNFDFNKLAGGQTFSIGDKTFEISTSGALNDPASGNILIDLSGLDLTDPGSTGVGQQGAAEKIQAAIANSTTGMGADFDVEAVSGAPAGDAYSVTITAKTGGDAGNKGAVRVSEANAGAISGTYTAGKEAGTGVTGKFAKVSYDMDLSTLAVGDKITIGGKTITVVEDGEESVNDGKLKLADAKDGAKLASAFENQGYASGKLTFATGKVTIEGTTVGQTGAAFAASAAATVSVDAAGEATSTTTITGGLTLQIGDTAHSYNKLNVGISDMHAAALGLSTLDIGNQKGASDAMATIKTAINSVSGTRGDLGALQNRLEHTINNLGVMEENIQDAEATIRDTDVAQEMMAYTKNNILVQSAQAMLAQANQLPQGVLQLLG
jgi:flagellin